MLNFKRFKNRYNSWNNTGYLTRSAKIQIWLIIRLKYIIFLLTYSLCNWSMTRTERHFNYIPEHSVQSIKNFLHSDCKTVTCILESGTVEV